MIGGCVMVNSLEISDLKIGMKVSVNSLKSIMYKYIILVNTDFDGNDVTGTIAYIGDGNDDELNNVILNNNDIFSVHNAPEKIDGIDIIYDY